MKSNMRHTFRPALEALEGRLVPSWSFGAHGDAMLTAAQPAAAPPPAVDLALPAGPTTVVTAASPEFLKIVTPPAGPTTVVTAAHGCCSKIDFTPALPTENISLNFSKID